MNNKKEPFDPLLLDPLYAFPAFASFVVKTGVLQSILLHTEGRIITKGISWDIKHKRIGPGVYKVWVEETNFSAEPNKRYQQD